ncbi:MAG: hypothetical protein ABH821_05130 [archaeon]
MKAVFKIKTVTTDIERPKKREEITENFEVSEGGFFDGDSEKDDYVFHLVKLTPNHALIEYDRHYTVKGGNNPRNYKIGLNLKEELVFINQWGRDLKTKYVCLKKTTSLEE